MRLPQRLGLVEMVAEHVHVDRRCGAKADAGDHSHDSTC
jgi:hypothetical protein